MQTLTLTLMGGDKRKSYPLLLLHTSTWQRYLKIKTQESPPPKSLLDSRSGMHKRLLQYILEIPVATWWTNMAVLICQCCVGPMHNMSAPPPSRSFITLLYILLLSAVASRHGQLAGLQKYKAELLSKETYQIFHNPTQLFFRVPNK